MAWLTRLPVPPWDSDTDGHAAKAGLTCGEQDEISAQSHQRAEAATKDGAFAEEILPIEVKKRKETVTVSEDEGIRLGTTVEGLSKLRPAFVKDGTITVASSSQITDGAAAVVLTTRKYAEDNGLNILATLGEYGQTAGPDTSLPSHPRL